MIPLHPHPRIPVSDPIQQLQIAGDFSHRDGFLTITFLVQDPRNALADSLNEGQWTGSQMSRKDDLWKKTCFEAFWALPQDERYWELNLSAAGEWNLYAFDLYRNPQPPRASSDFTMLGVKTQAGQLKCELQSVLKFSKLEVSLCAVLQTRDAQNHYFSTRHAGEKPDFHLRQSLALKR